MLSLVNESPISSNYTTIYNKIYLNILKGNLCRRINGFKLDYQLSAGGDLGQLSSRYENGIRIFYIGIISISIG